MAFYESEDPRYLLDFKFEDTPAHELQYIPDMAWEWAQHRRSKAFKEREQLDNELHS